MRYVAGMELRQPTLPAFVTWLRKCFDAAGAHGSELVEMNAARNFGKIATFPADADDELRKAEALGWIVRGRTCSPTPSQRAFLGLSYAGKIPQAHASCWFWELAPRGSSKRDEALAWLKAQESTVFGIHRCAKPGCHIRVDTAGAVCPRTDARHE